MLSRMRIGTRYIILIGALLLAFWSSSVVIGVLAQRYNGQIIVKEQAIRLGDSVMNSLNYLMLTGQMEAAPFILEQNNKLDGISDLYIFRSPAVNEHFGKERDFQGPRDSFEKQVLEKGNTYSEWVEGSKSRIRVIVPYIASTNRKGINCLGCHQVKEDTILGGVSMVVSLEKEEAFINKLAWIFVALMILGLLVVTGIIHLTTMFTLNRPLGWISESLLSVAGGDLSGKNHIKTRTFGELTLLSNSLDETVQSFRDIVQAILRSTDDIRQSGMELEERARIVKDQSEAQLDQTTRATPVLEELKQISSGIGHQSGSQLEEARLVSELIDTMSGSMNQINERVNQIRNLQENMQSRIQKGQKALDNTGEGMNLIQNSTRAITEVLSAMNDISDRTQLLALNAAIEAARAGEVGQGFAVVAGEVSKLSQNSSEYADRISSLVRENQENVSTGSEHLKEVAQAFEEIKESVRNNADMIHMIADQFSRQNENSQDASLRMKELTNLSHSIKESTEKQLQANQEIDRTMNSIRSGSEEFNRLSRDLNEKAELLTRKSDELKEIMKKFHI